MTAGTTSIDQFGSTTDLRRWAPWLILISGVVALQLIFVDVASFPSALDRFFSDPIDTAGAWIRSNRRTHPFMTGFLSPVTDGLNFLIEAFESLLLWFPWYVVVLAVFLVPARVKNWKQGLVAAGALTYTGLVGLWEPTMETLALMSTAVLIAVVIGVPFGIWSALRPRVEKISRPILDAMQTIPAFVYFLPLLALFGIGAVNAAVATVIYAIAPVVRLTTLGIRQVPGQTVEASKVFGSTPRQTLLKVQLPMALPTILTGLAQTIMMALGIVVLAALIGAGGLGENVLQTLSQRRTGRGIATGLAIVAVAMVLERVWRNLAVTDPLQRISRRWLMIGLGAVIVGIVVGRLTGLVDFPDLWRVSAFDPIDQLVVWARDNLSWITRAINDFMVGTIFVPVRDFLIETVAWPVLVFVTGWALWMVKGWRLAVFGMVSLIVIGLVGMWALSIDTLVQVVMSTLIAVAIAVPVGIWVGRHLMVEKALGPVLDALQTIPSLVYIIPVVILFTVGVVPGIIASVLYAIVPGIRITALGIRYVPEETVEASRTFGATPRQTMLGVRIPLAGPTIMAAINQVIMMVLAMVIIAGLVGGGGLGFETIRALTQSRYGLGFEVAVAIVLMAMILDRYTQAWGERLQPPAATH
ncbi:MAG TPA: ABC transporter permease subunit [Acidimicrobiia bacterium]|nr:ABC transporter permease subunit [Acidimicrobiia bacterium]